MFIAKFELISVLAQGKGTLPIIVAQMDPDAMGAAVALQHLARTKAERQAVIYYGGSFGHPQNRAMANRFSDVRAMRPLEELANVATTAERLRVAIVDSSSLDDARLRGRGLDLDLFDPTIVIDHHHSSVSRDRPGTFVWIDEGVGAASTLLVELLRQTGVKSTLENSELLTLLSLGIYTDTNALASSSARDRRAFGWAQRGADEADFYRLLNYPLTGGHFERLSKAISGATVQNGRLITTVGVVNRQDADDISTVADHLSRRDDITMVVVWGVVDGRVRLSVRSRDMTLSLKGFLADRFGADSVGAKLSPDGRGIGGGLLTLDLGWLESEQTQDAILKVVALRLSELIFRE